MPQKPWSHSIHDSSGTRRARFLNQNFMNIYQCNIFSHSKAICENASYQSTPTTVIIEYYSWMMTIIPVFVSIYVIYPFLFIFPLIYDIHCVPWLMRQNRAWITSIPKNIFFGNKFSILTLISYTNFLLFWFLLSVLVAYHK